MINGKKSLFYTVLMAGALMSCGGPKQAPNEEVAKSGNPVFEGWYADPEGIIYGDTYWIYPTTSDLYEKQTSCQCCTPSPQNSMKRSSRIASLKASPLAVISWELSPL